MKPVKKKGRDLQPLTAMEEELFVTEHPVSASEDEDDGADKRRHQKLLEAISALGGKKRKKLAERTEAGLQVSEFGISAEGIGEKINLADLLNPTKKVTPLTKVKKQLNKLQEKSSVELPLSKEEAQKIQRIVSYKHTSEEISKWNNVVKENRNAEQLVFPLNDQPLKPAPIEDAMVSWKASTPLEMEIFSILHKNKQPINDPLLTPLEEASLKAMSLEEAKERRAELQKARALQSYYEAKARREKKIKSKKYHKVLKKAKRKEALKNFEELRKTNPDAALKELEIMQRARMQERMSLKHQNSGKWAKSKVIMAKYDEEARRAMQEQLEKNKELTRKMEVLSEDEEDKNEEEIIPDFVNDAQMSLEGANPWMTGKLRTDAKDPDMLEETRVEEVVVIANTDEPVEEEEEEEVEKEEEALLREFEDRRRLRKNLGEHEGLEPKPGSSAGSTVEDNAGKVAQFNTLFQRLLEQNKKEEKRSAPVEEPPVITKEQVDKEETLEEEEEEEGSFLIQSLERHRTMEDLEALGEQELLDNGRSQPELPDKRNQPDPPLEKPKISQPAAKTEGKKSKEKISQSATNKESKKSNLIDSEDILPAKERPVQALLLPTLVEEDDEDEDNDMQQKMIIQEAFAGDDVINDFLKEKRDTIEDSKPKDLNLVLPGWGEWGGTNLKVSTKKHNRFTIKAPPAAPRKDQHLPNVIINEKRNIEAAAHQVNELPFHLHNKKLFESTIRAPVGNTWNTERAVQKLTAPRVITKRGHIIEPITEDLFQKCSTTKKPTMELEKPETKPIPRHPKTRRR